MNSRKKQFLIIILLLSSIVFQLLASNVKANPIAPPRTRKDIHDLCIGPRFNETQELQLQSANVIVECFNTESVGKGWYNISNLANKSITTPLNFMSGVQCEVESITANGTELSYNVTNLPYNITNFRNENDTEDVIEIPWNIGEDFDYYEEILEFQEFTLEFEPYSYIELYIQWRFTSSIIQSDFKQNISHTGYSINGGKYWGGLPIELEQVKFEFHTDNFYVDNMTILVNIQNDSTLCLPFWASNNANWGEMVEMADEIQIEEDSSGIPYYIFQAENFTESYSIHIVNGIPTDTLKLEEPGILGYVVLVGGLILLGIGIVVFLRRRK